MSAVLALRAQFQAWIATQDAMAKQALMLSAQATLESMSVDEVCELMSICFVAGTICAMRTEVEAQREVLLRDYEGVPQ